MTLRQGLQDFGRRHRDSFLLASIVPHRRRRREQEHAIEWQRQATTPAGASPLPGGAVGSAQFEKRDVPALAARFFFRLKETIRPIPGNTQSRSSSTIIRSMFVSFLAILTNAERNGSEVVCCALMPKAV